MKHKISIQVLFLLFLSTSVFAAPVRVEHVEAELISEADSIQPGKSFWVAIRLRMDEGWHTYWRNPGDSGLATSVEWHLPTGFKAGPLEWPYPKKIESASLITFGYENEVLLLTEMKPAASLPIGGDQTIRAKVDWLSCKEICVPGQAELELSLPVSDEKPILDQDRSQEFIKARENLPRETKSWDLKGIETRHKLIAQVSLPEALDLDLKGLEFFPISAGMVNYSAPQKFKKTKGGIRIELLLSPNISKPLNVLEGVLVAGKSGGSKQAFYLQIPIERAKGIFYFFDWGPK